MKGRPVSPSTDFYKKSMHSWSLSAGVLLPVSLTLASCLQAGLRFLPLEFQKRIVNQAIQNQDLDALYWYCTGFILSALAGLGLKYTVLILQNIMGERILTQMRIAFFTHALTLPWTFFLRNRPGAISTLLINNLGPVGDYLGNAWTVPLSNILTLVVVGGYLAWLHPFLSLVSLCVYPAALLLVPKIQARANQANRRRLVLGQELSGKITETFSGIADIQAHAGYGVETGIFSNLTHQVKKARIRWRILKLSGKMTTNIFTNLSPFFIFLAGGYLAVKGSLDMGELVAFLSGQALLFSPWTELMGHIQVHQDALVQYQKVQSFFDHPPAQCPVKSRTGPDRFKGEFQVRGLTLDSPDSARLLDQISFEIQAGELIALVGQSGSGKSLLLSCMAGKIRDYQGRIRIDGNELSGLTGPDLARSTGIVSQHPYLFDGTVRENLLYPLRALTYDKEPDMDEMIMAIQQAGLYSDLLLFGLNRVPDQAFIHRFKDDIQEMQAITKTDLPRDLASQIRRFTTPMAPCRQTLLEQILGGRPGAKDASAVMAWLPKLVPMLLAHDLLEIILAAGMEFRIGTNGEQLSGGQRQRLALAGILLKSPSVLFLDEVGSGLDHPSRIRLSMLLEQLKGERTILAVEHNLAHIRTYDRILVMHQGRMTESGTYEQLMAQKGLFYRMKTQKGKRTP